MSLFSRITKGITRVVRRVAPIASLIPHPAAQAIGAFGGLASPTPTIQRASTPQFVGPPRPAVRPPTHFARPAGPRTGRQLRLAEQPTPMTFGPTGGAFGSMGGMNPMMFILLLLLLQSRRR